MVSAVLRRSKRDAREGFFVHFKTHETFAPSTVSKVTFNRIDSGGK